MLILIKLEAARAGKPLHFVIHSRAVLEVLEFANLIGSFGDQVILAHNED